MKNQEKKLYLKQLKAFISHIEKHEKSSHTNFNSTIIVLSDEIKDSELATDFKNTCHLILEDLWLED